MTRSTSPGRLPPTRAHALAIAAAAALSPGLLWAQAAPAADAGEGSDAVVVTGSRIRGIKPVGADVGLVTREAIETSGAVTTAQIVQQLPQVFNLGVSENSRGQNGGAGNITYGSSINLRGIGPFATLVLINGHRVVGQGTGSAAVDPSILPSLAIERLEIVADGASAIYGSDAVAGVANLIMRRNEKGGQAMIRYGLGDAYHERQIGASYGLRWNGGQVTFTAEKTARSALSGRDRDFFRADLRDQGGGDFRGTQCAPGNITISGVTYPIPAGGVTSANASALVPGPANRCDNQKIQDLIPKSDRDSFALTFNQTVSKNVELYGDLIQSRRTYVFRPGAANSTLTVPNTNPFYVRPPGAPAGTSETVAYSWINDLPVNTAAGSQRVLEGTVGVDIDVGAGWKVGALYTYGDNYDIAQSFGGLNNAGITAALADRNPATALNVFGGPNNPATMAVIGNALSLAPGHAVFQNATLKADGPLFQLPGGAVRAAAGLEWQNLWVIGGQTTGPVTAPITGEVKLERRVASAYGELLVPIVGKSNAMTGIRSLSLSAAVRTDRYSDVGNTTNPKIGLSWAPVDSVNVRASFGESFRAPGLTQIRGFTNGGRGGLFVQNYSDPTNGGALRVGVALSAQNPDLKPETAKTKTFGIDWDLGGPSRTKLSLTWFDIDYKDQIVGYLSDLTLLGREALFAGTPIIQRNPSPALVAELLAKYPISGVPPATWTLFIDGRQFNVGRSLSRGFDFSASTRLALGAWGDLNLGLNGTRYTKYDVQQTPVSQFIDSLNTIYNPLKFKVRGLAQWGLGPWTTNLTLSYLNGYTNNLATPAQQVTSSLLVDARVAYAFESGGPMNLLKDATLAVGAVNLFDKKPPFVNVAQSNNGGGGFDPTLTSPVGRVISVTFDKRF